MKLKKKEIFKLFLVPVASLVFGLLPVGCRAIPLRRLRRPQELSREEVIAALEERTLHFSTLRDTRGSLDIVRETVEGRERFPSVRALMAFDRELPGLYLRTERLGQNIFTLRAHKDGFWLEIPDTHEIITGSDKAYERMPHLIRPGEAALWFANPRWLGLTWDKTLMHTGRHEYVFEVELSGFPFRKVTVDRYDLHINSITSYDILAEINTVVEMDRYRWREGGLFPYRLAIYRPQEGYDITLNLGRPEFDHDIPESFFMPRERPGWEHIDLDRSPPSDF